MSGGNEFSPQGGWTQSRVTAPPHREEPTEVVQISGEDVSWMPAVSDMSDQEQGPREDPGHAEEIIFVAWASNVSVSFLSSCRSCQEEGRSGPLC